MTRGIKEWLRRWLWELPDDCDPIRVGACPDCSEEVLVVHRNGHKLNLTRQGERHSVHPRGRSIAVQTFLSEIEDTEHR